VALSKGKVLKGQPEFAVEFANNMFVFSSEENMQEFLLEPKKFIMNAPEMPKEYRMLMLGPKGMGVHS
jgi:YHS domain-containing protein